MLLDNIFPIKDNEKVFIEKSNDFIDMTIDLLKDSNSYIEGDNLKIKINVGNPQSNITFVQYDDSQRPKLQTKIKNAIPSYIYLPECYYNMKISPPSQSEKESSNFKIRHRYNFEIQNYKDGNRKRGKIGSSDSLYPAHIDPLVISGYREPGGLNKFYRSIYVGFFDGTDAWFVKNDYSSISIKNGDQTLYISPYSVTKQCLSPSEDTIFLINYPVDLHTYKEVK